MSFTDSVAAQFKGLMSGVSAPAEMRFREEAWRTYEKLGLPDRKTESWKYTSLSALTRGEYAREARPKNVFASNEPLVNPDVLREIALVTEKWKPAFDVAVMLDGVLRLDLSHVGVDAEYGLRPLAIAADATIVMEDGFLALSAAMARPGFELEIPAGTRSGRPLLIVHANSPGQTWFSAFNQIHAHRDSQFQLVELHLSSGKFLRSEITTAKLGERARLTWLRVQNEGNEAHHFADVQTHLKEAAVLNLTQLNSGSLWARSTLRAEVAGVTAEAHVQGLTFGRGQQHIDQRVDVRHTAGSSVSDQLFKGILKDRARGVLNGKIYIARDAQKVASRQLNHNLLLSPGAEADTKPELEIYADDVKANHGASIGRMDEGKIFYLMSRGLPRALAQQMLAHAFVGDVVMKIPSKALRAFADAQLDALLPAFSREMEATLDA